MAIFERTIRGEVQLSTSATSASGVQPVLVAGEGLKPLPRLYNPGPAFYTRTWFLRPVGTASGSSSARWRSGTKPGVSTQNSKEMPLGSVT